jgi:hypothetical protein
MRDMIFVHGTGVRQPSYDEAYNILEHQLSISYPGIVCIAVIGAKHKVAVCGAAVPRFQTTIRPGLRETYRSRI